MGGFPRTCSTMIEVAQPFPPSCILNDGAPFPTSSEGQSSSKKWLFGILGSSWNSSSGDAVWFLLSVFRVRYGAPQEGEEPEISSEKKKRNVQRKKKRRQTCFHWLCCRDFISLFISFFSWAVQHRWYVFLLRKLATGLA